MDAHRQYWNQQQQLFRQSLKSKNDHQATIRLFLNQHAMLHSAEMSHSGLWSFEDEVFEGLTEAQMRSRPAGDTNSIAWLIWHIARIEDVTMNLLVAAHPQVLDEDDWIQQLHLGRRDVGTSMSDSEVADFSNQVDCCALRAYRAAVGRRTRAIVSSLQPAELWERIDSTNIHRLTKEGALAEAAYELAQVWSGWKKAGMLTMPATRHSFTHLNAAYGVRRKLVK